MELLVLKQKYSIYKFIDVKDIPDWIYKSEFYSYTRTKDEISVVAVQNPNFPDNVVCNDNWRLIKINEPLDFALTGIIAEISGILSENKIPIFTISTFNTDYFLVKDPDIGSAIIALQNNGHTITSEI